MPPADVAGQHAGRVELIAGHVVGAVGGDAQADVAGDAFAAGQLVVQRIAVTHHPLAAQGQAAGHLVGLRAGRLVVDLQLADDAADTEGAPVALPAIAQGQVGQAATVGVGAGVGPGAGDRVAGAGEGGGFRVFQRDAEAALGVAHLGLAHEDHAVGGADEVDRFRQCGRVHEVGPGLAGQPVVPVHVGVAQGHAVGIGGSLVAQRVAEEVHLEERTGLVARFADVVDAQVEARELGMGVEIGARALAAAAGAFHRGLAREVQRTAGGVVGQLAIAGLGGQEVGLDEAADLDRGARCRARGDGGDLDRLLAGRHLCNRLLLGLHRAHFGYRLLGLADLGLLLLLRRQQQLDLAFQFGNACFQCLLFGGLCERHARCDQGDQQAGRQRCAHGFQRTVAHVALSPKWQGDAARGARSSRDCGAIMYSGYSPLVEPGPAGRSLSTMV